MKAIYRFLMAAFCLTTALSGCNKENSEINSLDILSQSEIKVGLNLKVNSLLTQQIQTRSENSPQEDIITSIWVTVWEDDNNGGVPTDNAKLLQLARGSINSSAENTELSTAFVVLEPYTGSVQIRVVANLAATSQAKIEAYKPAFGQGGVGLENATHFSSFKNFTLELSGFYKSYGEGGAGGDDSNLNPPYPMSTERITQKDIKYGDIINADLNICAARIDILSAASDFTLIEATVIKGAKYANLRRNADIPYNLKPDGTTGGTDAQTRIDYAPVPARNNIIQPIYIFPQSGTLPGQQQGTNPTDLIVKGMYKGVMGYYKIQVYYGNSDPAKATYDIERNTLYQVNISKVCSYGYLTLDEAESNTPANMEYSINVGNSSSAHDIVIANGDYYMGFTNSEYIAYVDGARTELIATTMTHNALSTVETATVTASAGITILSQEGMTVVGQTGKFESPDGTEQTFEIKIAITKTFQSGTLDFRIGNLIKTVAVSRKDYKIGDAAVIADIPDKEQLYIAESKCDWITFNTESSPVPGEPNVAIPSGGINIQLQRNRDKYRFGTAYLSGGTQRGRVKVDIDQYRHEVVYYEHYTNGTWGFSMAKSDESSVLPPSLTDNKSIDQAGYGLLIERDAIADIVVGTQTVSGLTGVSSGNIFDASIVTYLYRLDQTSSKDASKQLQAINSFTPVGLKYDGRAIDNVTILPNFAKGCYVGSDGFTTASIRTPQQMQNITQVCGAISLNKVFNQEKILTFDNSSITIGGKPTFSTSIVNSTNGAFRGTYNGGTIQKLTINASNADNIGIFSTTNTGATIKNVTIYDCNITGRDNVGGLCGANTDGILSGITITGSKTFTVKGANNVGGLCGTSNSAIGNSHSNSSYLTVIGTGNTGGYVGSTGASIGGLTNNATVNATTANANTGGIVGRYTGVLLQNFTNNGKINGVHQTGGIVGIVTNNSAEIKNCTNTSDIIGANQTGGIVGSFSGTSISNCKNQNKVIGGDNSGNGGYVGGIVGWINNATISLCTNSGSIVPANDNDVGGIAGYAVKTNIDWCDNTGAISGTNTTTGGSQRLGGIVGWFNNADYQSGGYGNYSITNCSNKATVTSFQSAAGIAGRLEGRVVNCYNNGNITAYNYPAGIVGYTGNPGNAYFENCYNSGQLDDFRGNLGKNGGIVAEYNNSGSQALLIKSCFGIKQTLKIGANDITCSTANDGQFLNNVGTFTSFASSVVNRYMPPIGNNGWGFAANTTLLQALRVFAPNGGAARNWTTSGNVVVFSN